MPRTSIVRTVDIKRTARVAQLEGIFDLPVEAVSESRFEVNVPLEDQPWHIGLVVGPSGSGKTTIARELFGEAIVDGFEWSYDKAIVDDFPSTDSIKDITRTLGSVGFSSPPSWLRPYRVLSTGEQFRATVARAIMERTDLFVLDEFTSVVDRTVAQIGSSAIAKAIRRREQHFIALSCHYDIIDWLQPDWIYEPATDTFTWRSLQPRPTLVLTVRRVHHSAWEIFRRHHYLNPSINRSAICFMASLDDTPVAFVAALTFPHPSLPSMRLHRTVCLPDFQGVGIGNALDEFVCGVLKARGKPVTDVMSHPIMIRLKARSPMWNMHRAPSRSHASDSKFGRLKAFARTGSQNRITAGFEYVGPVLYDHAVGFGVVSEAPPLTLRRYDLNNPPS